MNPTFPVIDKITWFTGTCLVAAAWLVVAAGTDVRAGDQQGESHVKLTATAEKTDAAGWQTVTIKMQIDKGWHAHANPVKNEELKPNQTEVKISGAKKLEGIDIAYPPGQRMVNGTYVFQGYEGSVDIKAKVKRAPGDSGPLEITVKYVTCNESLCLPAETVKLAVK